MVTHFKDNINNEMITFEKKINIIVMENRYLNNEKIAQQVKCGKNRDVIWGKWDLIGT